MRTQRKEDKQRVISLFEEHVSPLLHTHSFTTLSKGRHWCRRTTERLDFIEIRFADVEGFAPAGLTAASFDVLAGTFFRWIPHPLAARFNGLDGLPVKDTASCHFVRHFKPGWTFSRFRHRATWYVGTFGRSTASTVRSASHAITRDALAWLECFENLDQVAKQLQTKAAYEIGARAPTLTLGFLALRLHDYALAAQRLREALAMRNPARLVNPAMDEFVYQPVDAEIKAALARAMAGGSRPT